MPRIEVALPTGGYSVHIGAGLLSHTGQLMRDWGLDGSAVIVTHPDLPPNYGESVRHSLAEAGIQSHVVLVPSGEASKSLAQLSHVYEAFAALQLDRRSTVVALGGGVIGDLAGFAAATYLRGLALVQVPTTLLAQVDASVGGKTAIDLPTGKNLVGAFHQPRGVIADVETLASLPATELRSGLAEVVKYGVIADADLFESLERDAELLVTGDPSTLAFIVERSCQIKADVVRQDPHEQGLRAILNYGHTVGHAIEAVLGYGVIPHGAAVSLGMSAAAEIAVRLEMLESRAALRQDALLRRLGLPTLSFPFRTTDLHVGTVSPRVRYDEMALACTPPHQAPPHWRITSLPPIPDLLSAMARDKKTIGGRLRFVLARSLGTVEVREVPASMVTSVLEVATLC